MPSSVGRHSKYNEEILTRALAYVQHCQGAKGMPFIEELALALEVNEDTIVEWAKEHDEFSATVKMLKMLQKWARPQRRLKTRSRIEMERWRS